MNRAKLTKLLEALKAAMNEVAPELEKEPDAFVVHVYRARRDYDADSTRKGHKRLDDTLYRSFIRARELGFRGTAEEWRNILTAFPPRM